MELQRTFSKRSCFVRSQTHIRTKTWTPWGLKAIYSSRTCSWIIIIILVLDCRVTAGLKCFQNKNIVSFFSDFMVMEFFQAQADDDVPETCSSILRQKQYKWKCFVRPWPYSSAITFWEDPAVNLNCKVKGLFFENGYVHAWDWKVIWTVKSIICLYCE